MKIDYTKIIALLMPTFLRGERLSALYAAVSAPLVALWADFLLWQSDVRLQAAVTCQVMYLEAILNYRLIGNFLRTIYLSDGDGVSADFIVNIPAGLVVNGQLLISLIEKYKLKGKRYSVGQSTVTYEISWTDYTCELNLHTITYEAVWTDHTCELELAGFIDNHITTPVFDYNNCTLVAYAQYAVLVDVYVVFSYDMDGNSGTITVLINAGSTESNSVTIGEVYQAHLTSISPNSDNTTYNYVYFQ